MSKKKIDNKAKLFVLPRPKTLETKPSEPEKPEDSENPTPVELLQTAIDRLTTGDLKDSKYTDVVILLAGEEAEYQYKMANAVKRAHVSWMLHGALLANMGVTFAD